MDVLIIELSVSQVISSQVKISLAALTSDVHLINQHQMAVPSKSEQLY